MNIKYIQKLLFRVDEIKTISKTAEINGVVCNVAGLIRNGQQLRLVIVEYDEQYRDQIEERETFEICEDRQAPETNRIMMKSREKVSQPFSYVKSVIIGDTEYEVKGSEGRRLSIQDGESVLFLSELLRNRWNPEGVDNQHVDMLFVTTIDLAGDYDKIPELEAECSLRFVMGKNSVSYLVEQPVTLIIDGKYSDKLWFKNKDGEVRWTQINRVYLSDMWVEMEKAFSHPKLLEQMTNEEIDERKKEFEENFSKICPKGMCFPIIEYECEDNISLEFYTKKFLESMPVQKNGGMGFIVGADKPTGVLGMKLKVAIIQEPVPMDTKSIKAEIFQYYKTITPKYIII